MESQKTPAEFAFVVLDFERASHSQRCSTMRMITLIFMESQRMPIELNFVVLNFKRANHSQRHSTIRMITCM